MHVLPDEIARARITLHSLLPRESASKEVDAATLAVIGFPAFAVKDEELVDRTRSTIVDRLQGNYGCKRFLRDGHQTALEDHSRLHYEPNELKIFEHIECEWPLFFTYLLLDAQYGGAGESAAEYRRRLEGLEQKQGDIGLLPELYYVPASSVEAEKEKPGSQTRLPNENVPLVWAQSLWWLGQMRQDGLLDRNDWILWDATVGGQGLPFWFKLPSWRRISKRKPTWRNWESALSERTSWKRSS